MYVMVLFTFVWTLYQSIVCESCLIKNSDLTHINILTSSLDGYHEMIIRKLSKKLNKPFVKHTNCPSNLQDALKLTKDLKNVIYLGITDFYKNNYNDVANSHMIDKDYGSDVTVDSCLAQVEHSNERKNNAINTIVKKNCNVHTAQYKQYTMLISKNLTDLGLQDVDSKIEPIVPQYSVLIYNNTYNNNWNKQIYEDTNKIIRYHYFNSIEYTDTDNVIAIAAPRPKDVQMYNGKYAAKPIIFYEALYYDRSADLYENAITRQRSTKHMVLTLLDLILTYWKRVAILSDDLEESEDFEKELRNVFEKNDVSYTVRSVAEQSKCCNFSQALSSLRSVGARIIVANVHQKHAQLLAKQAKEQGMTIEQDILWIARAWSVGTCLKQAKDLLTLLSVTKTPNESKREALQALEKVFTLEKATGFYLKNKKFAAAIRQHFARYETNFQVIGTVNGRKVPIDPYNLRAALGQVPTDRAAVVAGTTTCSIDSVNYDRPCDDVVAVLLALVVVVFLFTMLAISCFFQLHITTYSRMA